jgi:hypothetical protein
MNNLDKTIRQLQRIDLNTKSWDSGLIKGIYKYIDLPIKVLDIEGLRLLIGQNIGLEYLIPLAIDKLQENILAEGDLYAGDLLKNVLDCNRQIWVQHNDYYKIVVDLYLENISVFESDNIYKQIRKSFEIFNNLKDVV